MAKSMPKGAPADVLAQVLKEFLSTAMAPPPTAKKVKAGQSPKTPCPDCGEYPCECGEGKDDDEEDSQPSDLMPPVPMGGRRLTISILMPTKGMMKKRGAK